MRGGKRGGWYAWFGVVSLAAGTVCAAPEDGNRFTAFAADQFSVDDNLYRLPDGIDDLRFLVGPDATRQDHLNAVSAGAEGQWTFGRQALVFDLRADRNHYSHNGALDNTSGRGRLAWNWRAGPRWTGEAGASYSRTLAGFANTRFLRRDLIDRREYFASGRLRLGPRWSVKGGVERGETTHGVTQRRGDDFRSSAVNAGVEYTTPRADTFGWNYHYARARFPQGSTPGGAPFDRDYDDSSAQLLTRYALSGKTRLDASGGYLRRRYANGVAGNFSGGTWRATLKWEPSAKTELDVAAWRELSAYQEAESDYFVARGVSMTPAWMPTSRLAFAARGSWIRQEYLGSNPAVTAFVARSDRLRTAQASLTYAPRVRLKLQLVYRYEQRDSTRELYTYDDRVAAASVRFTF